MKKNFFEFFLEFIGDVVPVPNLKICFFFGFSADIKSKISFLIKIYIKHIPKIIATEETF